MSVPLSAAVTLPDAVGSKVSAFVQSVSSDCVWRSGVGCACYPRYRQNKPKLKVTICRKPNISEEASSSLRTSLGSFKLSTAGFTHESLQYPFVFMDNQNSCHARMAAVATDVTVTSDELAIVSAAEQAIAFAAAALNAAKDAMEFQEGKACNEFPSEDDLLKLEKLRLSELVKSGTCSSSGQVSVFDNLDVSRFFGEMILNSEYIEKATSCADLDTASRETDQDFYDVREMLEQTFSSLAELKSVDWNKEVLTSSKSEVIEVRSDRRKERIYKRERIQKKLEKVMENLEASSGRVSSTRKPRSSSSGKSSRRRRRTIKKKELLTAAEEKHLAGKVQYLLEVEKLRAACEALVGREPTIQELASAAGIEPNIFQRKLWVARRGKVRMVYRNFGLVVSIAKHYQGQGIPLQDLVQEGVSGLIRGIEKYKPALGFRLSTYVHWWIREAVSKAVATKSKATVVPVNVAETLSRVHKVRVAFCEEHGRPPTEDEVVKLAKLSSNRLRQIERNTKPAKSADKPIGKDGFSTLGASLTDDSSESDQVVRNRQHMKQDVDAMLQNLSERERDVLTLRFPTDGRKSMTLEDIGIVFNLTRERIRQIERIAMQKLKCPQSSHLKCYFENL